MLNFDMWRTNTKSWRVQSLRQVRGPGMEKASETSMDSIWRGFGDLTHRHLTGMLYNVMWQWKRRWIMFFAKLKTDRFTRQIILRWNTLMTDDVWYSNSQVYFCGGSRWQWKLRRAIFSKNWKPIAPCVK